MYIVKFEQEGGLWVYEEFDNLQQVVNYLKKNSSLGLKVRLIGEVNPELRKKLWDMGHGPHNSNTE